MSSWRMWNVWMKRAGSRGALNHSCRIDTIPPMHGNSQSLWCSCLLALYIFWYLMSFNGILRQIGIDLLIIPNFFGVWAKLQEINLPGRNLMIDRHTDTTKSILFVIVPLDMYIRSYFFMVYLSVLRSLGAVLIYSGWNGATACPTLLLGSSNVYK